MLLIIHEEIGFIVFMDSFLYSTNFYRPGISKLLGQIWLTCSFYQPNFIGIQLTPFTHCLWLLSYHNCNLSSDRDHIAYKTQILHPLALRRVEWSVESMVKNTGLENLRVRKGFHGNLAHCGSVTSQWPQPSTSSEELVKNADSGDPVLTHWTRC